MKFVPAVVPEFHKRDHAGRAGVCQLASHIASEVRIFPAHGVPPVIFTCPATSSFADGVEVPIPTFPEESVVLLPSTAIPKMRLPIFRVLDVVLNKGLEKTSIS